MSEFRRLFFALWPDEQVCKALADGTREFVEAASGRAVHADNLHITLAFLHNVNTKLLPCIADAAHCARTGGFTLQLDRAGYWYRSKILWLGPTVTPPALDALVRRLWRELGACGFTPERRPFRPHITLARKASHRGKFAAIEPIAWPVTRFALVESITGQPRSTYKVVETWPLDAQQD